MTRDIREKIEEAVGLVDMVDRRATGRHDDCRRILTRLRVVLEEALAACPDSGTVRVRTSSLDPGRDHYLLERENGVAVFTLTDTDLISDVPVVGIRQALEAADLADVRCCVLDFSRVCFLSSVPLGALIALNREVHHRGGRLAIAEATAAVRDVFSVTRLDTIITLCDSVEDAIDLVSTPV